MFLNWTSQHRPHIGPKDNASITILTAYLQNNLQRVPKGAEKALAEAPKLKNTTTERIFLDHGGKQAWLAFYGVTKFTRRVSERTTIKSFRKLSVKTQKEVARRVGGFSKHPSIATAIDRLSQKRRHRRKLQNLTETTPTASSVTFSSCATPLPLLNETQIIPTTIPEHSSSNDVQLESRIAIAFLVNSPSHATLPSALNETQIIPTANPEPSSSNDVERFEVHGHFPQQWIAEGLNKDLCDVIGMVTMSFSRWGTEDCVMTLAIPESKVEYLAKSLFVHCIGALVFPGGAKAFPYPAIVLKGVEADLILRVFGSQIYAAIMASCLRAEGLANGVEKPQGVSSPVMAQLTYC
ncbi:hypothetical protein DL98DRAFT_522677 [Cadophora sp. DSE1049]|nr:hypothetical protein DL98DRAFT_522677 [Cadophora sp. DSE1049]